MKRPLVLATLVLAALLTLAGTARAWGDSGAQPELVLQNGHRPSMRAVALSPLGDLAATAADEGTAKLWELATGRVQATLQCPADDRGITPDIRCVAFSADGRTLATGCSDGALRLWDVATARLVRTVTWEGSAAVERLDWHPGGHLVAVQTGDGTGFLVDLRPGTAQALPLQRPGSRSNRTGSVKGLAFTPDGALLVQGLSLSEKAGLLVHRLGSKEPPTWMPIENVSGFGLETLACSPDSRQVVAGWTTSGTDPYASALALVDLAGLREVSRGSVPFYPLSLAWGPDGIVAGGQSDRGPVSLVDPATLAVRQVLLPPGEGWVPAVAAGGGHLAAAALNDGSGRVWDLRTRAEAVVLKGRLQRASCVAVSSDGARMATGGYGRVSLWDLQRGRLVRSLQGLPAWVYQVAFAPGGARLYAADGGAGQVAAWSTDDGKLLWRYPNHDVPGRPPGDGFTALALSPDGRRLAVGGGSGDGRLVLLDAATGQVVRELTKPRERPMVFGLAFEPGSSVGTLAVARADGSVEMWDTTRPTGPWFRRPPAPGPRASDVCYSPDGRRLAVALSSGQVLVYEGETLDPAGGRPARELSGWGQDALGLAFSPDGRTLAAAHVYTGIDLFDPATGKRKQALTAPTNGFGTVTWTPDGRALVSTALDSTVRIWEPSTGRLLGTALALEEDASWVATTPDGLFDGSSDGQRTLQWRIGDRLFNLEQFFSRFYRPGLLAELAGPRAADAAAPAAPRASTGLSTLKPPPRVTIDQPQPGAALDSAQVQVAVTVQDQGGGFSGVRLYVNGHRIPDSHRTLKGNQAVFDVRLSSGPNTLRATAFNAEGSVESRGDHLRVQCRTAEGTQPALHVLAVGINRYQAGLDLRFARPDAEAVAAFFKPGLFGNVQVHTLLDEQATKAALVATLRELGNRCDPRDVLLLFLAGHGTVQGDLYYFLPADARVETPEALAESSLSSAELAELLAGVTATKQLVILDSCHSGAASSVLGRYLASRDALGLIRAQQTLARASGTFLIAAASPEQTAKEYQELGHGVLTSALLAGLGAKGNPGAAVDGEGRVTVNALIQYVSSEVPRLEQKYGGTGQDVVQYGTGHDFPLLLKPGKVSLALPARR